MVDSQFLQTAEASGSDFVFGTGGCTRHNLIRKPTGMRNLIGFGKGFLDTPTLGKVRVISGHSIPKWCYKRLYSTNKSYTVQVIQEKEIDFRPLFRIVNYYPHLRVVGGLVLLISEILHHLGCIKPCSKTWEKLLINCCRISSINSITPPFIKDSTDGPEQGEGDGEVWFEAGKWQAKTSHGGVVMLWNPLPALMLYLFIPPKTNMSPENQWLEDVFPIKTVPFKGTC